MTDQRPGILHITPWFPTDAHPLDAIFIQRHIASLDPYFSSEILHISTEHPGFSYSKKKNGNVTHIDLRMPFRIWRLREMAFAFLLRSWWKKFGRHRKFVAVNFHIAYPAILGINNLDLPKKKIITEHWSIYHFNFYSKKKIPRIRKIFSHGIPVISVSKVLAGDIQRFSGETFPVHIIPNVVDDTLFNHHPATEQGDHFFMAARWRSPKDPFSVIMAIAELRNKGIALRLRLGGFGPQMKAVERLIHEEQLNTQIELIGPLTPEQMAHEFRSAMAFILPTKYETFSVVCAEALCCGCPVISEHTGALPELIDESNGLLKRTEQNWKDLLVLFRSEMFDREEISCRALSLYSRSIIGNKYASVIHSIK